MYLWIEIFIEVIWVHLVVGREMDEVLVGAFDGVGVGNDGGRIWWNRRSRRGWGIYLVMEQVVNEVLVVIFSDTKGGE